MDKAGDAPGDGVSIETTVDLGINSIPLMSIEIVRYLDEDNQTKTYVRWQGVDDVVQTLGLLEFAKMEAYALHVEAAADEDLA